MINLTFIIFAIMLCNFKLIRTINNIFPLFVGVFCNAFFDWHPVSYAFPSYHLASHFPIY